jgi:hypothetical protein
VSTTVHFYALHHGLVLPFIPGNGAMKVRGEFNCPFGSVIHWRKSVDAKLEFLE